jgi:hypothetical protein
MTTDNPLAIACSLAPGEYPQRLREFTVLFASIRELRREPARLYLALDASTVREEDVRDVLRREQACCPFFTFLAEATNDAVHVEAAVPEGAEAWLDGFQRLAEQATATARP